MTDEWDDIRNSALWSFIRVDRAWLFVWLIYDELVIPLLVIGAVFAAGRAVAWIIR